MGEGRHTGVSARQLIGAVEGDRLPDPRVRHDGLPDREVVGEGRGWEG